MSNIVQVTCTDVQQARADTRLAELQAKDPEYAYNGVEGIDDLIHHGHMLTRLPADEIQTVVARANEIIAGG